MDNKKLNRYIYCVDCWDLTLCCIMWLWWWLCFKCV